MKKLVLLTSILFGAIFLSGCDLIPEEIEDYIPAIELAGESYMVIEVGSEFVDPGAVVIGDIELNVTTETDLDVNTVGTYAITYTIEYAGMSYDVVRTISVVDSVVFNLNISFTLNELTKDMVSFNLSIENGEGILRDVKIVIYEDKGIMLEEVYSIDIVNGNNTIEFIEFSPLTSYKIQLEGEYTLDEVDYSIEGYYIEFTTLENNDPVVEVPSLELIGDAAMTVELYDYFTDPGVNIIGDFDLEITTVTDFDQYTVGIYTVTYSVVYEDITYEITRTVEVVDTYVAPIDFILSMSYDNLTRTSVEVTVMLTDPDSLLTGGHLLIFDGFDIVGSLNIVDGVNYLEFTNLEADTYYRLALEGSYQEDGTTKYIDDFSIEILTLPAAIRTVTLLTSTIDSSSIYTMIEVVDSDWIMENITASVYQGDTLIEEKDLVVGGNYLTFSDLEPDTDYKVIVNYEYPPEGNTLYLPVEINLLEFTTDAMLVPTITSSDWETTFESIECTFGFDLSGITNESFFIQLWEGSTFLGSVTLDNDYPTYNFYFDSVIEDNTEYTLKLYADYADSTYSEYFYSILIDEFTVTTPELVSYVTPYVINTEITSISTDTGTSVTYEFDLLDPDSTISGTTRLRLTDGSRTTQQIITVGHNVITFEGYPVYENIAYTLNIVTTYSPNSGEIKYDEIVTEETLVTPPYIAVTAYAQEEMFYQGDSIILVLDLDNDEDIDIEYVTINGTQYSSFLFPSNNQKLYIYVGIETSSATYNYTIEKIGILNVNHQGYEVEVSGNVAMHLEIEGTIVPDDATINLIDITTDDYTKLVHDDSTDYSTIYIYFENKYNMPITSIKINSTTYDSTEFTVISSTEISLSVEKGHGANKFYLSEISFTRNSETVAKSIGYTSYVAIYGYYSEDIVHISTAAELQAINPEDWEHKYYILDNDINLSGINFDPIGSYDRSFGGVFDGNGHTIYNLTINSGPGDQESVDYIGLFGYSGAYVIDLEINNANITVTTNTDHFLYVGVLTGYNLGNVNNVYVVGSTITVNGLVKGMVGGLAGTSYRKIRDAHTDVDIVMDGLGYAVTSYWSHVGGLVGMQYGGNIESSSATGSLTITNSNDVTFQVGGITGELYTSSSYYNYIMNSYSSVDISVENTYYGSTGGLVGISGNVDKTSGIINSYSSGDVYAVAGDLGGLVGHANLDIYNSFSTSDVSSPNVSPGRLVDEGNNYRLHNCYKYDGQVLMQDGHINENGVDSYGYTVIFASSTQYNDPYFYTKHLGWSSYFFNFDTLDVENGDLPTHN